MGLNWKIGKKILKKTPSPRIHIIFCTNYRRKMKIFVTYSIYSIVLIPHTFILGYHMLYFCIQVVTNVLYHLTIVVCSSSSTTSIIIYYHHYSIIHPPCFSPSPCAKPSTSYEHDDFYITSPHHTPSSSSSFSLYISTSPPLDVILLSSSHYTQHIAWTCNSLIASPYHHPPSPYITKST